MRATLQRTSRLLSVALLAFLLVPAGAAPVPAKGDEAALREQVLKLNDVTGKAPIEGQIRDLVDRPAETKKLLAVAVKMAKEKDHTLGINATYILAKVAHRLKDVENSEGFYRMHAEQGLKLGSTQKFVDAYIGLIDLFYQNGQFDKTEKVCREFLELRGDDNVERLKMIVLRRLVMTQAKQGKGDDAMKIVENLIKAQPENWLNQELKGQILRETGKYDEAVTVYEDVIDRITKDKRLDKEQKEDFADDIRYALSGVYVDLKKIDKAAEQLKTLLKRKPNDATYNNDLGFIWADHDMNLDEAERLIRKALEEDKKERKKANPDMKPDDIKNSASYLDSLGWVLFKKKKYKDALEPMLEAIKQEEGQHLEIYDHLGDIYLALDRQKEAVESWKKGLECKLLSKRDELRKVEVEKKIKKHSESKDK
jgi:tetratricopeptide (TPR) repeat protein